MRAFPFISSEDTLYAWMLLAMIVYLVVALSIQALKSGLIEQGYMTRLFDSLTFTVSSVLLMGIVDPEVLKFLGSTKPFLMLAGLAGVTYSLVALKPK